MDSMLLDLEDVSGQDISLDRDAKRFKSNEFDNENVNHLNSPKGKQNCQPLREPIDVQEKLMEVANNSKRRETAKCLRIRAVDALDHSVCCIINFWEDKIASVANLKENTAIIVTCVDLNFNRQLKSTKQTEVLVLKDQGPRVSADLLPHFTDIVELSSRTFSPIYSEVNCYGFVVSIEEDDLLYLSDELGNLVAVYFRGGFEHWGYKTMKSGTFHAFYNLELQEKTFEMLPKADTIKVLTYGLHSRQTEFCAQATSTERANFIEKVQKNLECIAAVCSKSIGVQINIQELKNEPVAFNRQPVDFEFFFGRKRLGPNSCKKKS